jgi:phasin family protein
MVTKAEQFSEMQRKSLDAAMRLAQLSIENSQRIMELQVQTAKSLFEESVTNAKALATTQDPKTALELRAQFAQATAERMLHVARSIAQIATETQAEFGQMMRSQLTTNTKDMMDNMQKMLSFNPAAQKAAESAMGTLQNAFDSAQSAFDQMTKVATEAFSTMGAAATKAATGAKRK